MIRNNCLVRKSALGSDTLANQYLRDAVRDAVREVENQRVGRSK
jgi:hypothetical protein